MKDKPMDFMENRPAPPTKRAQSTTNGTSVINSAGRTGRRGLTVIATFVAAVSLTAAPIDAYARNNGAGIALGVLGGALAGAAIASTANSHYYGSGYGGYSGYGYSGYPTYTAPAQSYYYAPQSSYYPQATYYSASPYYGNYGSSYAPYYGNSYYYGGR
jgi:hypothetical protein